ncbi:MAG: hypothetical protein A2045_12770 [Rhodocyclales bacterium GWA2_65_20]|nr:MAG: hypothetical protein A2045_12770 [Rhodocyclales bacterium GWA2_65_20]
MNIQHLTDSGTFPPVFDRDHVIENFGGDEALLKQIAALFIADWPQCEDRLRSALAAGEAEPLRGAAHAIKGAVGNFAAERAVQAAKQLEMSCKAGDVSQAPLQVEDVLRAVGELMAALRAEVGA